MGEMFFLKNQHFLTLFMHLKDRHNNELSELRNICEQNDISF